MGGTSRFARVPHAHKSGAIFSRPPSNLSGYTATPTTALSFEPYAEVQRLKRGPTREFGERRLVPSDGRLILEGNAAKRRISHSSPK